MTDFKVFIGDMLPDFSRPFIIVTFRSEGPTTLLEYFLLQQNQKPSGKRFQSMWIPKDKDGADSMMEVAFENASIDFRHLLKDRFAGNLQFHARLQHGFTFANYGPGLQKLWVAGRFTKELLQIHNSTYCDLLEKTIFGLRSSIKPVQLSDVPFAWQ